MNKRGIRKKKSAGKTRKFIGNAEREENTRTTEEKRKKTNFKDKLINH